jgi:hypothetical protein
VLQRRVTAGPVVTAAGTVRAVALWTAVLAAVAAYVLAVVANEWGFAFQALAVAAGIASILALYLLISSVTAYFHWRRVYRQTVRGEVPKLRAALAEGRVRATTVQASAVVEIEEDEDEGSAYLYDIGEGRVLLLVGQRYAPIDDGMPWPNTEFEIVRTTHDDWVGIFTSGRLLAPAATIARAACDERELTDDREEVVAGTLEEVTRRVRRRAP